jgi:hypothetical protein
VIWSVLILKERKWEGMKRLVYSVLIVLYALLAFFGLGPILMADGTMSERLITLYLVLFIYFIITFLFLKWKKKLK